jgi:hypothetical protein
VYRLANNISSLQIIFKEEKRKFMVVEAEWFFPNPMETKEREAVHKTHKKC